MSARKDRKVAVATRVATGHAPLNARLAELEQTVAAARAREREVEREHEAVKASVAQLGELRIEAFAAGDEAAAKRLAGERADAERTVGEYVQRLEGARRATRRAEVELSAYAVENLDRLLRERVPEAQTAVQAVTDAIEALHAAHGAWTAVEAESMRLLRLAGRDTRDQPRFPERLAELVRDARRVDGVDVPLPLPVARRAAAMVAAERRESR